jgi:hypothetical protein
MAAELAAALLLLFSTSARAREGDRNIGREGRVK